MDLFGTSVTRPSTVNVEHASFRTVAGSSIMAGPLMGTISNMRRERRTVCLRDAGANLEKHRKETAFHEGNHIGPTPNTKNIPVLSPAHLKEVFSPEEQGGHLQTTNDPNPYEGYVKLQQRASRDICRGIGDTQITAFDQMGKRPARDPPLIIVETFFLFHNFISIFKH